MGTHANILILDDNTGFRAAISLALEQMGFTVLSAGSPREAETLLTGQHVEIDLLLTDVVLPNRSGRDFYHSLDSRHRPAKVLYMSGYNQDFVLEEGMLDRGSPYIGKPFGPEQLLEKIREVLESNDRDQAPRQRQSQKT